MVRLHIHMAVPDSDVEEQAANSTMNAADLQLHVYAKPQLEQGVHFQVKEGMLVCSISVQLPIVAWHFNALRYIGMQEQHSAVSCSN